MQTPWDYRYAQRTQRMKASAIRELLKFTEQPDMISFGGGFPAAEVFPVEEFKRACNYVLEHKGAEALQYGGTDGYVPLREMIARHTNRIGITVDIDNILITSGSQQALDLLGKIFINRGDRILVESPTYLVRSAGLECLRSRIHHRSRQMMTVCAPICSKTPCASDQNSFMSCQISKTPLAPPCLWNAARN